MAEINTTGLEELSDAFMRHEAAADKAVEEMLQAEADEYVKAYKHAAAGYGIRKTGGFIESIKAGSIKDEGTANSTRGAHRSWRRLWRRLFQQRKQEKRQSAKRQSTLRHNRLYFRVRH